MNFSIAQIIARLWAPRHELSCSWFLWRRLLREAARARPARPAGRAAPSCSATSVNGRGRIVDFILYDDLDPHALDTGIVHFDGRYFGALWDICKHRGLSVVADVHVHPGGSGQSGSDQRAPDDLARRSHRAHSARISRGRRSAAVGDRHLPLSR